MVITVTREDIKHGIPLDQEECAVARALRRHTGESIFVNDFAALVDDQWITLPNHVVAFIKKFDEYKTWRRRLMWPVSFEFDMATAA